MSSTEYPDVLGDLIDARQRFDVNGVHYLADLSPTTIAPGETTRLRVWMQNCWNVPVQVSISLQLPAQPAPVLTAIQQRTVVPLEAAEVGEVTIPIASVVEAEPMEYEISATLGTKFQTRGLHIRSKEHRGHLGDTSLSFLTGMSLATTMGLGFSARTQPRQRFSLRVVGPPNRGSSPDMTPTYLSHWTVDDLAILGKARQHVNDQRLYLLPKVTRQALYMAFLEESKARFADAALPLHIGEAIFLAKIMTHCVEYFMALPEGADAILVPAYMLAFRYGLAVHDPIFLVVRADYARIARLACSLSFGLLRRQIRRDIWSIEEQVAVTDLIADRAEHGDVLSAEFLYLPLLLGGLMVADGVQMPGEDLAQSLELFAKAREQRSTELAENPELVGLLDRLSKRAQSGA